MIWSISLAPDGAWVASSEGQDDIVRPMFHNHADVLRMEFARAILAMDSSAVIAATGSPEAVEVSDLISALRAEGA